MGLHPHSWPLLYTRRMLCTHWPHPIVLNQSLSRAGLILKAISDFILAIWLSISNGSGKITQHYIPYFAYIHICLYILNYPKIFYGCKWEQRIEEVVLGISGIRALMSQWRPGTYISFSSLFFSLSPVVCEQFTLSSSSVSPLNSLIQYLSVLKSDSLPLCLSHSMANSSSFQL